VVSVDILIAFGTSEAIDTVEKALPTFDENYQYLQDAPFYG